ncbi:MAG: lysophospholipid acyltransferase family protein [Desulfovibrionaceae bacterium]
MPKPDLTPGREVIFQFGEPYKDPIRKVLFSAMKRPLARLLCFKRLNQVYRDYKALKRIYPDGKFEDLVAQVLKLDLQVPEDMVKRIPKTGPLLVVSNHPFGVVDGLLLFKLIRMVRDDVRALSNQMMMIIPEYAARMYEVDVFGGKDAAQKNMAGTKKALKHLRSGGALLVFPAGEVASLRLKKRMVRDNAWNPTIAGIGRRTGATFLPVCFQGHHGPLFNAMGLIHPRLRTAMIPRANLRQTNKPIHVYVGNPLPPEKLARYETDKELIDYLRFRTHLLCRWGEAKSRRAAVAEGQDMEPIAEPLARAQLIQELASLTEENILVESGPFVVFEAGAARIPGMLREIGRLREETFRPVGEGTGQSLDLDRFDETYRHLVLYNREENEVAGAYRFARCDEIMARQGVNGLYSRTLFKFGPELMDQINPALEFGRSFILAKYQRSYQALLLLWKAIGVYMHRDMQYKTMFGCVSMSSDYSEISREVMIRFLKKHSSFPELAKMIKPKRPPKLKRLKRLDVSLPESAFEDPENLGSIVEDIEHGRGIPVLFRQYMKLGGRILAFNIDPDFGDCMDGLILVDIPNTPRKMMDRFMGPEAAEEYLIHHGKLEKKE